jgi:hypothetical protein
VLILLNGAVNLYIGWVYEISAFEGNLWKVIESET